MLIVTTTFYVVNWKLVIVEELKLFQKCIKEKEKLLLLAVLIELSNTLPQVNYVVLVPNIWQTLLMTSRY